jgi:hypothetical protein
MQDCATASKVPNSRRRHVPQTQKPHKSSPASAEQPSQKGFFTDCFRHYKASSSDIVTYDHRSVRTGHPVRSAIHKH